MNDAVVDAGANVASIGTVSVARNGGLQLAGASVASIGIVSVARNGGLQLAGANVASIGTVSVVRNGGLQRRLLRPAPAAGSCGIEVQSGQGCL